MRKLVGLRPTGKLHIGHYFSVIKPAVEFGCDVLVAYLHAPGKTFEDALSMKDDLELHGIDRIRIQCLDEKLFLKLINASKVGELSNMTQYKTAKPSARTAHLLTYPVLMAHDVCDYDEVYVGEDQEQHLEYARKLLKRIGEPAPVAKITGGRVMNLKDPTKKMSKSEPEGCLFLDDDSQTIRAKIKKANTNPAGMKNLKFLFKEFVGGKMPERNSDMKPMLAQAIINKFRQP